MTGGDDTWLQRWSRRKRAAATSDAARGDPSLVVSAGREPVAEARPSDPPRSDDQLQAARSVEPPAEPPPLPAVEDLSRDSDYTPFLRHDVPADVHQRALRKLWTSDPVYGFRDGLTDYDEDYTASGIVEQVIATAYRPGHGYAEAAPAADVDDGAAEPAADPTPEVPVSLDSEPGDAPPEVAPVAAASDEEHRG